jgi:hypothetical protein
MTSNIISNIEIYHCAIGFKKYQCLKINNSLYFSNLDLLLIFGDSYRAENHIKAWMVVTEEKFTFFQHEGKFISCISEHQFASLLIWLSEMRFENARELLKDLILGNLAAR